MDPNPRLSWPTNPRQRSSRWHPPSPFLQPIWLEVGALPFSTRRRSASSPCWPSPVVFGSCPRRYSWMLARLCRSLERLDRWLPNRKVEGTRSHFSTKRRGSHASRLVLFGGYQCFLRFTCTVPSPCFFFVRRIGRYFVHLYHPNRPS